MDALFDALTCAGNVVVLAQVVRTRLHTNTVIGHRPLIHTVRTILTEEGPLGFYRGLATNLLRVVPAAATTFLTYELVLRSLHRLLPARPPESPDTHSAFLASSLTDD